MNQRTTKSIISLVVLVLLGGLALYRGWQLSHTPHTAASSTAANGMHRVIEVVDGDTAKLDFGGVDKTVRYIGMDTPEVVDPRKVVQCFGREASNRGHQLLEGQTVRLETDPEVGELDKYGRTLAYIWLSDGSLYNQRMISEGFAHEYTYQSQHYKYQAEFKDAQKAAQAAQAGLWSPDTCSGNTTKPAQ